MIRYTPDLRSPPIDDHTTCTACSRTHAPLLVPIKQSYNYKGHHNTPHLIKHLEYRPLTRYRRISISPPDTSTCFVPPKIAGYRPTEKRPPLHLFPVSERLTMGEQRPFCRWCAEGRHWATYLYLVNIYIIILTVAGTLVDYYYYFYSVRDGILFYFSAGRPLGRNWR